MVSFVGNLLTHMANCYQPVPGYDISGYITQGRGISVHRKDCEQFLHLLEQHAERLVDVEWGIVDKQSYQATIQIHGGDRQGLLRDISTIIANERLSIMGIESSSDLASQSMKMTVKLEISNSEALNKLVKKLVQLDDVIDVKRT